MTPDNSDDEGDGPHLSEAIGTRVSPGTYRQFEDYRDDHGLTNAEAMRNLVQTGLTAEGYSSSTSTLERIAAPRTVALAAVLFLAGLAGIVAAALTTTGLLYALAVATSGVAILTATLTTTAAMIAQMALARPLRGLVGLARGEPT
jgi:hypothetical protein